MRRGLQLLEVYAYGISKEPTTEIFNQQKLEINVERETDDVFAYFVPRMSLYLREFEFSVVWIHTFDFLPSWRSKNL